MGLGGAQGLYGVRPDLTALGKALGGGLPLGALAGTARSAVAGRASRRLETAQTRQPYVFHGGTYNGTPAALAAGLATLNILEEPGTLDGGRRARSAAARRGWPRSPAARASRCK